jgi:hypothetical protein
MKIFFIHNVLYWNNKPYCYSNLEILSIWTIFKHFRPSFHGQVDLLYLKEKTTSIQPFSMSKTSLKFILPFSSELDPERACYNMIYLGRGKREQFWNFFLFKLYILFLLHFLLLSYFLTTEYKSIYSLRNDS